MRLEASRRLVGAGTVVSGCYRDALTNLVVDAHTLQQSGLLRGA
jgi:hypothetical protein